MAKNTGEGYRIGSVDDRTQADRSDGHWTKRDRTTGRFMNVKSDTDPFKGIAKEPDGRRRSSD